MRAENKRSLLIAFQGMDAAGKNGSIDKLYNGLYPMSTESYGFKAPNKDEASRDFCGDCINWLHLLETFVYSIGHIMKIYLFQLSTNFLRRKILIKDTSINNFEELLEDNNTHVIKFYLHISKKSS